MQIKRFTFNQEGRAAVSSLPKGKNWPVVYLISNKDELYIGETTSAATRMDQHLQNPDKAKHGLTEIRIVFDDEYNKSVILDYEQRLIKCCKVDAKYNVLNRNAGQSSSHEYYQRREYGKKFSNLWQELVTVGIAEHSLDKLENQEIFKYSPYNSLTDEQSDVSVSIINDICDKLEDAGSKEGISLVNGCAGTGKTVLAISIINSLLNAGTLEEADLNDEEITSDKVKALLRLKKHLTSSEGHPLKIGFIFPMSGIRGTIKRVFKKCGNGLRADMVLSPYDIQDKEYDILFVDESHRLVRRKNLGAAFRNFDNVCTKLGFDKDTASQLDWILKQGKYNVLFYDEDQSIKGSDITFNQYFDTLAKSGKPIKKHTLNTQMRCEGGDTFVSYIKDIMVCSEPVFQDISNYQFRLFDNVDEMVQQIRSLDAAYGLCRTVAGYSWTWNTKPAKNPKDDMEEYHAIASSGKYDIDIDGYHYIWNLTTEDWISRQDSPYTIGCIHTTQGFDLNYVGVIFGKEIDYDPINKCITIDLSKFYDKNVKNGSDAEIVKRYIINTYTTIMARGIKGCFIYACNSNLQDYLSSFIRNWH